MRASTCKRGLTSCTSFLLQSARELGLLPAVVQVHGHRAMGEQGAAVNPQHLIPQGMSLAAATRPGGPYAFKPAAAVAAGEGGLDPTGAAAYRSSVQEQHDAKQQDAKQQEQPKQVDQEEEDDLEVLGLQGHSIPMYHDHPDEAASVLAVTQWPAPGQPPLFDLIVFSQLRENVLGMLGSWLSWVVRCGDLNELLGLVGLDGGHNLLQGSEAAREEVEQQKQQLTEWFRGVRPLDWEGWVAELRQKLEERAGLEGREWVEQQMKERVERWKLQIEQQLWGELYAAKEKCLLPFATYIAGQFAPSCGRATAAAPAVATEGQAYGISGPDPIAAVVADFVGSSDVGGGEAGAATAARAAPEHPAAGAGAQGVGGNGAAGGLDDASLITARQLLEAFVGKLAVRRGPFNDAAANSLLGWLQRGATNTLAADSKGRVSSGVFGMTAAFAQHFLDTASHLLSNSTLAPRKVVEVFALELAGAYGHGGSSRGGWLHVFDRCERWVNRGPPFIPLIWPVVSRHVENLAVGAATANQQQQGHRCVGVPEASEGIGAAAALSGAAAVVGTAAAGGAVGGEAVERMGILRGQSSAVNAGVTGGEDIMMTQDGREDAVAQEMQEEEQDGSQSRAFVRLPTADAEMEDPVAEHGEQDVTMLEGEHLGSHEQQQHPQSPALGHQSANSTRRHQRSASLPDEKLPRALVAGEESLAAAAAAGKGTALDAVEDAAGRKRQKIAMGFQRTGSMPDMAAATGMACGCFFLVTV